MDVPSLKLLPRTLTGKVVKNLRRQGIVPVHVYGAGLDPLSLQIDAQDLRRMLPRVGTNVPLSIEVDGQDGKSVCFVREVQRHPVTEELLHVDFMRVDISQTVRAEVPVMLIGNAPAVRQLSGTLLQPLQAILVEALPMNIPTSFAVDVSMLDDFEKRIYVKDLLVDPNVSIVADPEQMIARVSPPRIEVEEVTGAEMEVEEDGVGPVPEVGSTEETA